MMSRHKSLIVVCGLAVFCLPHRTTLATGAGAKCNSKADCGQCDGNTLNPGAICSTKVDCMLQCDGNSLNAGAACNTDAECQKQCDGNSPNPGMSCTDDTQCAPGNCIGSCDGDCEGECLGPCTRTAKFGDIVPPIGGGGQPNFSDIVAVVQRFRGMVDAPPIPLADLFPCDPIAEQCIGDGTVDFQDINQAVNAFKGAGCG